MRSDGVDVSASSGRTSNGWTSMMNETAAVAGTVMATMLNDDDEEWTKKEKQTWRGSGDYRPRGCGMKMKL